MYTTNSKLCIWAFKSLLDLTRPILAASSLVGPSHVGVWWGVARSDSGSSEATMAPKGQPGILLAAFPRGS